MILGRGNQRTCKPPHNKICPKRDSNLGDEKRRDFKPVLSAFGLTFLLPVLGCIGYRCCQLHDKISSTKMNYLIVTKINLNKLKIQQNRKYTFPVFCFLKFL